MPQPEQFKNCGPRKKKQVPQIPWEDMDAVEAAQKVVLDHIRKQCPSRLELFKKVYDGKATPGQVRRSMCLECVGFIPNEVRECRAFKCCNWRYRPYVKGEDETETGNETETD